MTAAPKVRVKLTVNNQCHRSPPNSAAVEDLITAAAKGAPALAQHLQSGGQLHVAAGVHGDLTALHALARSHSGDPRTQSGRADLQALLHLLDAGLMPDRCNRRGETAFHRAVTLGLVWFVEACHQRGLDDWERAGPQGRRPLAAFEAYWAVPGRARTPEVAAARQALQAMERHHFLMRQEAPMGKASPPRRKQRL